MDTWDWHAPSCPSSLAWNLRMQRNQAAEILENKEESNGSGQNTRSWSQASE